MNALFNAVGSHRVAAVTEALASGCDPRAPSTVAPFWYILEAAIEEIDAADDAEEMTAIIALLIRHGADVNAWDPERNLTPLLKAAYFRHPEIMRMLLATGADPNVESQEKLTPLIWAVLESDASIARELLVRGATKTMDRPGWFGGENALQIAVNKLDVPMVRLLLSFGADPAVRDIDGNTARMCLPVRTAENASAHDEVMRLLDSGGGR